VKRFIQVASAAALGIGCVVAVAVPAAAASSTTTCTDTLAPGSYEKVVVPAGASCITFAGPVNISAGLFIERGATFVLGSEDNPTPTGTIGGGVHATDAASVQIHFSTIRGGISIQGGSGPFGGPFDITWNTIEDSHISGQVTINGYNGFWMGFIRNKVNGAVNLNNNTLADPDGNEYVTNVINGSLNCSGNSPAPQVGDSEGTPNQVTGDKTGQCAAV